MWISSRKALATSVLSVVAILVTVALILTLYSSYKTYQQSIDHVYITSDSNALESRSTDSVDFKLLRGYLGNSKVFAVVDGDGMLYRVALKLLGSYGIDVHRLESLSELRLIGCPKILIINLDGGSVSLLDSMSVISELRRCSMNGTYVLLAFNNTKLADKIWRKLFEAPLPYTSNEITIAKIWSNGETEYITEKTFFIFGRMYKTIGGRSVPIDIGGSAGYRSTEDLEKAMSEALKNLVRNIVYIETNLGG